MALTSTIDFLYKRIESSETMAEKERILELFWDESEKIRARKNLNKMKHLLLILLGFGLIGCSVEEAESVRPPEEAESIPPPQSKVEQEFQRLKTLYDNRDNQAYFIEVEKEFADAEMPTCDEVPTAQTTCKWIGEWEYSRWIYMGSWKNGKPDGYGILNMPFIDMKYIGEWKDGKRHGQGTEKRYSSVNEFVGEWKDVFVGEWKDGERYIGTNYYSDGSHFTSETWLEESPVGTLTFPSGKQIVCKAVDDKCIGEQIVFVWVKNKWIETTKPSVNKAKSTVNKVKPLWEQVIEAQQRLLKGPTRNPELYSACSKDFQRYMQPFLDLRAERLKIGDQTALLDYRDVHLPTGQQFYLSCLRDGFRF